MVIEMSAVEPAVGSTARFVVHEHFASRHHFDLRLEGAGVLWSWALPKGMPTDPAKNRLAVRVDDHDLEHIGFVDPTPVPGVEGATRKSIWDSGSYQVVRATTAKLVIDLDGSRCQARYALIHTDADNWILHLMG
jgi:bifunctional non-homologous end joining protein LigD